MTQGSGGWVLDLRCALCGAEDRFRGVLITLAADLARRAGWAVSDEPRVLAQEPGTREETCSKCTDVLGA